MSQIELACLIGKVFCWVGGFFLGMVVQDKETRSFGIVVSIAVLIIVIGIRFVWH